MRVITGQWRGSKLHSLPGDATRPTSDRVKEAIFNIIQFDVEGRRALDLFAGNGQLGIEALSRGARDCVFVDNSRAAADILRQNVEKVHAQEQSRVLVKDALAFLQGAEEPFGLIFIDPPYRSTFIRKALALIAERNLLQDGGLIVCESDIDDQWEAPAQWNAVEYRYGRVKVTVYGGRA
ncbi:MAG: 16S rRNA (guanine(966)-N(2))-methyltransferase RsmD [Oscillospiraceae bacterium]|nr:16S rRNA (guanine(966)-N(2))-methyltransferase RsmD [Oscillospiraceae bacterium]